MLSREIEFERLLPMRYFAIPCYPGDLLPTVPMTGILKWTNYQTNPIPDVDSEYAQKE